MHSMHRIVSLIAISLFLLGCSTPHGEITAYQLGTTQVHLDAAKQLNLNYAQQMRRGNALIAQERQKQRQLSARFQQATAKLKKANDIIAYHQAALDQLARDFAACNAWLPEEAIKQVDAVLKKHQLERKLKSLADEGEDTDGSESKEEEKPEEAPESE